MSEWRVIGQPTMQYCSHATDDSGILVHASMGRHDGGYQDAHKMAQGMLEILSTSSAEGLNLGSIRARVVALLLTDPWLAGALEFGMITRRDHRLFLSRCGGCGVLGYNKESQRFEPLLHPDTAIFRVTGSPFLASDGSSDLMSHVPMTLGILEQSDGADVVLSDANVVTIEVPVGAFTAYVITPSGLLYESVSKLRVESDRLWEILEDLIETSRSKNILVVLKD